MSDSTAVKAKAAGAFQGWILVSSAWLAVMSNIVVSPILPKMTQHFSSKPSVELLISLKDCNIQQMLIEAFSADKKLHARKDCCGKTFRDQVG